MEILMTLWNGFVDGLARFDAAMRSIAWLPLAIIALFTAAVVLAVAWVATGLMERLMRRMWGAGWFARLVFLILVIPLYVIIVVRTEVGAVLAFVPMIPTEVAIVIVFVANAIAIWYHARNEAFVPVWLVNIWRRPFGNAFVNATGNGKGVIGSAVYTPGMPTLMALATDTRLLAVRRCVGAGEDMYEVRVKKNDGTEITGFFPVVGVNLDRRTVVPSA